MSLDETLRDLMAERSSGRAVPAGHLDQIHRRLVRRRARRLGTAAAATVVALAALTGAAIAWSPRAHPDGPPTTSGESTTPSATGPSPTIPPLTLPLTLPDRDRGQILVQQKTEPLSPGRGEFTLVFTPRQWNFSITMRCVTATVPAEYQIEVLINGSRLPYVVDTCNRPPTESGLPDQPPTENEQQRWWQHIHAMIDADTPVRLNEPMTITIRVGTPQGTYTPRTDSVIIRSGAFTAQSGRAVVGIYQPG